MYSQLNDSGESWPPEIYKPLTPLDNPYGLKWWERIIWRLGSRRIKREIELAARLTGMSVIEHVIGKKEVLRWWDTKGRTDPFKMTDAEFEEWWLDPRGSHEKRWREHEANNTAKPSPA